MLDQFADELKKEREKKGITLLQMSADTRIDIKFLEAIDNGNFSFLPELYVKAFLKQYAKSVGLDEELTVKKYDSAKLGMPVEQTSVEKQQQTDQPAVQRTAEKPPQAKQPVKTFNDINTSQQKKNSGQDPKAKLIMFIAVVSVTLVALVLYLTVFKKSQEIIVEEKPYEEVVQDSQSRFEETEKDENNIAETTAVVDSMQLKFTNVDTADTSWIYVICDNSIQQDFLLYPRNSKSLKAVKEFKFTLGNSGVIQIELNNKPVSFEGRRKSVRYFKVDNSGIQKLDSPPSLQKN